MAMRGILVARILRRIAEVIERLSDQELEKLAAELNPREFLSKKGHASSHAKNRHAKIDPFEIEKIYRQLNELDSRERGIALLDELNWSRKELESLAKHQKVHIIKEDPIKKIKEKIVERVIGSKLSSRAIRGQ